MGKAEEFVIYPILLLLSWLTPCFYMIDDNEDDDLKPILLKGINLYAEAI